MDKAGGGSSLLYYGADGRWSKPVVGTPAGDLPVGTPGNDTLVKYLTLFGEPIVWRVIGKDLPGMPAESVTLFSDKIVALRCFDAQEPLNPDNRRSPGGNNDWGVSNLRQWMNSAAPAGQWYSPQHEYDAPPDTDAHCGGYNAYQDDAGMLYESTQVERGLLLATTRNYGGWTSNGKTCVDKLFLLTTDELGIRTLDNNGTKIPYFTDTSSRISIATTQCVADTSPNPNITVSQVWPYSTMTSYPSDSYHIYRANPDGNAGDCNANNGHIGVRPACNIPQTATISLEPDESGCYSVL